MPRHKDGLILIGAAALFLFVSRPVCAQLTRATAADSDDAEDEKTTPIASLTITPSETGRTQVNFYLTAVEPSTLSENLAAVENALGCNLQLDPRFSRTVTVMYGSCTLPLSAVEFHREGRIQVAPLAEYAKSKKIERLVVMIYLPDTDTFDSQPAPASSAFGELKRSSKALRKLDRNLVYSWQLDSSVPEIITFSFGYSESSVHRAELVLALVLAVPLLFVYWLGRKALSAPDSDKAAVGLATCCLQWSLTGASSPGDRPRIIHLVL
jgi:hypothetical protein